MKPSNKELTKQEDKTMTTMNNFKTLEMEELEIVSGGTVTELDELIKAFMGNSYLGDLSGMFGGHVPGANYGIAALVEECLENHLGIEADISLGFAGTGIGSDPNTYIEKSTGRRLSHGEVLQRIINYNG